MSITLDFLQNRYGPLLPIDAVAEVLNRSPQGLRVSLGTKNPLSDSINAAKLKIGRRIYFRAEIIASIVDGETCVANE